MAIDGNSLQTAGHLMAASRVPLAMGDLDAAADLAGRAVTLCASVASVASVASGSASHAAALATLAAVRQVAGDLSAALDLHRRALAARQAIAPLSAAVATALNNLGAAYQDIGDLARALDHFERARNLQRDLAPASVSTASMYSNVGAVLLTLDDQEGALREFAAARAIDENAIPDSPQLATDLFHLGGVIESRETAAVYLSELREVGVGDLSMTDNLSKRHVTVGNLVRPELMARVARNSEDHGLRGVSRLALTNEQPDQAALGQGVEGREDPLCHNSLAERGAVHRSGFHNPRDRSRQPLATLMDEDIHTASLKGVKDLPDRQLGVPVLARVLGLLAENLEDRSRIELKLITGEHVGVLHLHVEALKG
jgi:tetratricopeptide (TPR) repeat protein